MAEIHVIYKGNKNMSFEELFPENRFANIGIAPGTVLSSHTLTDQQIKTALAQHFDVGLGEFEDFFVEMNPNGNVTVRPNATFA